MYTGFYLQRELKSKFQWMVENIQVYSVDSQKEGEWKPRKITRWGRLHEGERTVSSTSKVINQFQLKGETS